MKHLLILDKDDLLNQQSGLVDTVVDGKRQYLHFKKIDMHISKLPINSIYDSISGDLTVSMNNDFSNSFTVNNGSNNSINEEVFYIFLHNNESILIGLDGNKVTAHYGHINKHDFIIISIGNKIAVYEN